MADAPRTLLVDFDIVVFKHALMNEHSVDWLDGTFVTFFTQTRAEYNIMQFLDKMLARCKCDTMLLFITGAFNYRYAVLPSYKHNRVNVEKPALMPALKEWAMTEYNVITVKGLEADDLLGIYATKDSNTVLATIDKDMKQIPCRLYLWNKDTLEDVSIKDADQWFYRQILTGDSTDGYAGCPGIGPKKADEILNNCLKRDWWSTIVSTYGELLDKAYTLKKMQDGGKDVPKKDWWTAYIKHCEDAGSAYGYALQQARVARICRVEDYNEENQTPILWTPKS